MAGPLAIFWIAAAGVVALVFFRVLLSHSLFSKKKGLPPGTMGWPFLGETLEFLASRPTFTRQPFIEKRMSRFGEVFKTHLFGQPVIISADRELNKLIFHDMGSLFKGCYPMKVYSDILGRQSIVELQGNQHRKVHGLASQLMGLESLKGETFDSIQTQVIKKLSTWQDQIVHVQHEAMSIVFGLLLNKLIHLDPDKSQELQHDFDSVKAFLAFPFNIPGSGSTKYMQGHKQLTKALEEKITERKRNTLLTSNDLLGVLLKEKDQEISSNSSSLLLDNIMGFLYHSQETTAMTLTLILKLISESPKALNQLRDEHLVIRKRKSVDEKLNWEDYKSMNFTQSVIKEGLRIANVVPWVLRDAVKDVVIKGFVIPKGWRVLSFISAAHLDSKVFQDPQIFNPWRWQDEDESLDASSFTPFGEGERLCPGAEFARMIIAVFIHFLITRYSWQVVEEDEIIRFPVLTLQEGFPIAVKHLQDEDECLILH